MEGTAVHDGNPLLTGHVVNARRRPSRWGLSFGKVHREHPAKVDALAAAILASMARMAYMQLPDGKRRRQRSGKAMFV